MSEIGKRIIFKSPGNAELEEFNVREPRNNECVVKIDYSLISNGTEKAYLAASPNTAQKFPTNPGYSSTGRVIKVGKDVRKFNIGDRVFVAYGGHASYNIKPESSIEKIPDNVSMQEAVFTRLASFPLLALRRSQLEIGESVVIVGLGMLGLFGVQLAKIGGGLPVVAIGNRENRKKLAMDFGATAVFSPDDSDLTQKIKDCTKITGLGGPDVVIETSGTTSGLKKSLEYVAKNGRVLVNGCNRVTDEIIDFYKYVHLKGVQIIGAHDKTRAPYNSGKGNWTAHRDYLTLLGYMSDGRLRTKELISDYIDPRECNCIYRNLIEDRNFPMGVIWNWKGD